MKNICWQNNGNTHSPAFCAVEAPGEKLKINEFGPYGTSCQGRMLLWIIYYTGCIHYPCCYAKVVRLKGDQGSRCTNDDETNNQALISAITLVSTTTFHNFYSALPDNKLATVDIEACGQCRLVHKASVVREQS